MNRIKQFPEQTNPPKTTDDAGNEHGKHGHQGRWAIAGVGGGGREHGATLTRLSCLSKSSALCSLHIQTLINYCTF